MGLKISKFSFLFIVMVLGGICANYPSGNCANYSFYRMWPVLKQPWYFDNPSGIAIDQSGYVYIADTFNHRIQKYNANGELITKWGQRGNGIGEFNEPDGIAVDRQERVYVADSMNLRIQVFNSAGLFLDSWAFTGDDYFKPSGIAVDDEGYVYIVNSDNLGIYKFTEDGRFVKKWGVASVGQDSKHIGIAIDSKGFIYASDIENNCIRKYNLNGDFITKWGDSGENEDQFNSPSGIAVDFQDNIYVVDKLNDRISVFSSDGIFLHGWGQEGFGDNDFNAPSGIAIDPTGYAYVTDSLNDRIHKFTLTKLFADAWRTRSSAPGEFIQPQGIATDGRHIYVSDKNNHRIQKFEKDGELTTLWGSFGDNPEEFNLPYGIAIHGEYLYVADTLNNRIQKFTKDGEFVSAWGSKGTGDSQFNEPSDVAVDGSGNVYVVDWENHRVQKFDSNGKFIKKWGEWGSDDGEFKRPFSIAIDNNDRIYVTDTFLNGRIQLFDTDGNCIGMWEGVDILEDGFSDFCSITVDSDGSIYLADSGNDRIIKLTQEGMMDYVFGKMGSDIGQLNNPSSLCVDQDNMVYVVDSDNNRIQVFKKREAKTPTKAIIIAGGGPFPGNKLWDATRLSCNFAYRALHYQGIQKSEIHYLSSDLSIDLDDNDKADDIDDIPSKESIQKAMDEVKDTRRLIVYLADHGGDKAFRLSASETLSALELKAYLDNFQTSPDKEVIVIYDACNAESFLEALRPDGEASRILIGSSELNQNAYFINQGTISFSIFFWTRIFNGQDLDSAYNSVSEAYSYFPGFQNPVIEKHGSLASIDDPIFIGNGANTERSAPNISVTIEDQKSFIEVTATIDNWENIRRVWAVMFPPSHRPDASDKTILELPSVEMFHGPMGKYKVSIDDFKVLDEYEIAVYAKDRYGNIFHSHNQQVDSDGIKRQRAILVIGNTQSIGKQNSALNNLKMAYAALVYQGFKDEEIVILGPSGLRDHFNNYQFANLASMKDIIDEIPSESTEEVLIYFIGEGSQQRFKVGPFEDVLAQDFDMWLDRLQNRAGADVVFIYDADFSGSFIPELLPPPDSTRILITSTSVDSQAYFMEGDLSFSSFFWNSAKNGMSLSRSFNDAKNALSLFGQEKVDICPQLDDNGNGIANENGDGKKAANIKIGLGLQLAGNNPRIAIIRPEESIFEGSTYTIWVDNISSINPIEKVWAVISPPVRASDRAVSQNDLPIITLEADADGLYKADYDGFNQFGKYQINVYASDINDEISYSKTTSVFRSSGPDVYEPDDRPGQAGHMLLNSESPQTRSFHDSDDVDWIKLYAIDGNIYEIQVKNEEAWCESKIEIYDDHFTRLADSQYSEINADNIYTNTISWLCDHTGVYYIKVSPLEALDENTCKYSLDVFRPIAPFPGYIKGRIFDAQDGEPISEALIKTDLNGSALSLPNGYFMMIHEPGTYLISAEADGYLIAKQTKWVSEAGTTVVNFELKRIVEDSPSSPPVVSDTIPSVSISSPASDIVIETGDSVFFQGNVRSGDAPFTYRWFFDGAASDFYGQNPEDILFQEAGRYTVLFRVVDTDGDVAEDTVEITVEAKKLPEPIPSEPLSAAISSPSYNITISQGETVQFKGSVTGGKEPFSYHWTFGSIDIPESTSKNPGELVFTNAGAYRIHFIVTDSAGNKALSSIDVEVISDKQAVVVPKPIPCFPEPGQKIENNMPFLQIEPYSIPEGQISTNWQISTDMSFETLIFETVKSRDIDYLPIMEMILDRHISYFWRVRFINENGEYYDWSDVSSFSITDTATNDTNQNGIPDSQETKSITDIDGNGVEDKAQSNLKCIRTILGNEQLCLKTDDPHIYIESMKSLSPDTFNINQPYIEMPFGCTAFKTGVFDIGRTVSFTIYYSKVLPEEFAWYHCDYKYDCYANDEVLSQIGGREIHFTIQDGGKGDIDGVENGVIVNSSFIDTSVAKDRSDQPSYNAEEAGGMGCFIKSCAMNP